MTVTRTISPSTDNAGRRRHCCVTHRQHIDEVDGAVRPFRLHHGSEESFANSIRFVLLLEQCRSDIPTRSVAVAKKADRTAYNLQYSCRIEPQKLMRLE